MALSDAAQELRRAFLQPTGPAGTWVCTFLPAASLFAITAHWWGVGSVDTVTVAEQAYELVRTGSIYGDGPVQPGISSSGITSQPGAGIIATAAVWQFLLSWTGLAPVTATVLLAVLMAAATTANLAVVLRGTLPESSRPATVAITLATSTSLWSIAAAEFWTHTADSFWLSLLLLILARHHLSMAGLVLAPALLVRPHLAVVALAVGVGAAWQRRSLITLAAVGVPSVAALGALRLLNAELLDSDSVAGTYAYAPGNATSTSSETFLPFVENIVGTVISPYRGLLVMTPLALVAVPAIVRGWRSAPSWTRWCAIGGVLYLLVQMRINHFTGGSAFYGNRYLIEPLLLATPLVVHGWRAWVLGRPWRRLATRVLAAVSIVVTGIGAAFGGALPIYLPNDAPWTTWLTYDVVRSQGTPGLVLSLVSLALGLAVALRPSRGPVPEPAVPERAEVLTRS